MAKVKKKPKTNKEWEYRVRILARQEAIKLMLEHLGYWHKEVK